MARGAASELDSSSHGAVSVVLRAGVGGLDGAVVLELESFCLTPTPAESIRREGKHNGNRPRECGWHAYLGLSKNVLTLIFNFFGKKMGVVEEPRMCRKKLEKGLAPPARYMYSFDKMKAEYFATSQDVR